MPLFRRKTIAMQDTLGCIFAQARVRHGMSLTQAAGYTGIREKYLQALEEDEFEALPGEIYARHYVTRYAAFLGLPVREAVTHAGQTLTMRNEAPLAVHGPKFVPESNFAVWPARVKRALVSIAVAAALTVMGAQVARLFFPPALAVAYPPRELLTYREDLTISGKTEPGARVRVNGRTVTADAPGYFTHAVRLTRGVNTIVVTSQRRFGKKAVVERKVVRQNGVARGGDNTP